MHYKVTRHECGFSNKYDIVVTITEATVLWVDTRSWNCFVFVIGDDSEVSAVKRFKDGNKKNVNPMDILGVSGNATALTLEGFDTIKINPS